MSESEQAQTIGKSEALHEWLTEDFRKSGAPFISENHAFELYRAHAELLEIVDSQAQKIKEQAARISELEKEAREHVCCLANNGWTVTIEQARDFLDSLDGEKGFPEEMHRMLVPGKDAWQPQDEFWSHIHGAWYFIAPERVGLIVGSGYYGNTDNIDKDVIARRAESRQIPNLKEKVKAFGIACMNAEKDSYETDGSVDFDAAGKRVEELRALCAPRGKAMTELYAETNPDSNDDTEERKEMYVRQSHLFDELIEKWVRPKMPESSRDFGAQCPVVLR